MKNELNIKLNNLNLKFAYIILAIFNIFLFANVICQEESKVKSSLKSTNEELPLSQVNLIPMPIGDLESASKKVNFDRNPFQSPSESEQTNPEDLDSAIEFKGIANTLNNLVAIIKTRNGQKFYNVGDTIDNGFLIKSISLEDVSVDITNGFKDYRLTLVDINNRLRKRLKKILGNSICLN